MYTLRDNQRLASLCKPQIRKSCFHVWLGMKFHKVDDVLYFSGEEIVAYCVN